MERNRKKQLGRKSRSTAPAVHPLHSFCFECVAVIDLGHCQKGQFTSDTDNQPIPLREQTERRGMGERERERERRSEKTEVREKKG